MRAEFESILRTVHDLLVGMARATRVAMGDATSALQHGDVGLAQSVIARDTEIDRYRVQIDDLVFTTIARQAPVAVDLRTLFAAVHVAAHLERMGDLAAHVAEAVVRRHPEPVLPWPLITVFATAGEVADRMADKVIRVLSHPNAELAGELDRDDDAMDVLHRDLLRLVLEPGHQPDVATAIDAVLLGRYYERYADHAVDAGRQVAFLVTGRLATTARS
jgi:phosphate transport system protein